MEPDPWFSVAKEVEQTIFMFCCYTRDQILLPPDYRVSRVEKITGLLFELWSREVRHLLGVLIYPDHARSRGPLCDVMYLDAPLPEHMLN